MSSRRLLLAAVLLAACGKGGNKAGSGSGSAAPPAPAPPPVVKVDAAVAAPVAPLAAPVCFPAEWSAVLDGFGNTDSYATVCATDQATKASKCIAVDLFTGKATETARPPAPPAPPSGGYTIQNDGTSVSLCKGSNCTKLALAGLGATDGSAVQANPSIAIAPGGSVAIAPLPFSDPKVKVGSGSSAHSVAENGIGLYDTSSGRRMKVLDVAGPDFPCGEPSVFLGDKVIYATASACPDQKARAALFNLDGSSIATLPDEFNLEGGVPVHLDGDTWAVSSFQGAEVLVFEVKTGRTLRSVPKIGASFRGPTPFAVGVAWPASPLGHTSAGKLVVANLAGGVAVIDPSSGKVEKALPLPVCAPAQKAPEPAGSAGPGAGSAL